jgi:hypothetical protein
MYLFDAALPPANPVSKLTCDFCAFTDYPRFTPGQWDDVFLKAKNDGYNMIQTYFFHNVRHNLCLNPWTQYVCCGAEAVCCCLRFGGTIWMTVMKFTF